MAAAIVMLLVRAPVSAGQAVEDPVWSASLVHDLIRIDMADGTAYWRTSTAGLGRRFSGGSVTLYGLSATRAGRTEHAAIVDTYADLWDGAYGNLRLGFAPTARMLARLDAGGEVFQAIGSMELSASVRRQEFETAEVSTFGLGTGHYLGRWYVRPRAAAAHVRTSWSPFAAVTARRYLGDGTDDLLDLSVGGGEEVLEVPGTGATRVDVLTSSSRYAGLRIQRYPSRHFGFSIGGSYSSYRQIRDRWGLSAGVMTRW
jgi:YaiO family outer membrane protein